MGEFQNGFRTEELIKWVKVFLIFDQSEKERKNRGERKKRKKKGKEGGKKECQQDSTNQKIDGNE